MSSIQINGDTSGSVILQAPSIAGSTTLTLPSTSGTIVTTNTIPAGQVIQVVNATYATQGSTSSSTYADSGLTASITPSSSSNKILVLVNMTGMVKMTTDTYGQLRLLRGSTSIVVFETAMGYTGNTSSSGPGGTGCSYLDSPATTSSTTYKVQIASQNNTGIIYWCNSASGFGNATSTITLMEIKA